MIDIKILVTARDCFLRKKPVARLEMSADRMAMAVDLISDRSESPSQRHGLGRMMFNRYATTSTAQMMQTALTAHFLTQWRVRMSSRLNWR